MQYVSKGISFVALSGCLYGSRDGTFADTGRYSGSRYVYVSIILIAFVYMKRPGSFSSRLGGISAQAGRFLSCKRFTGAT